MLRGMTVTVVHIMEWLMERQLDPWPAICCARTWKTVACVPAGAQTARPCSAMSTVACVRCNKDGNEIPADLVVMAAGIRPNTELAESNAACTCNRGIVVTTPCRP